MGRPADNIGAITSFRCPEYCISISKKRTCSRFYKATLRLFKVISLSAPIFRYLFFMISVLI